MTCNGELDLQSFKEYLESKNPEDYFFRSNAEFCPIAGYFREHGHQPFIMTKDFTLQGGRYGNKLNLPEWAVKFIRKVDHNGRGKVLAKTALKYLNECT